jgi:hypothetical protein
LILMMTDLNSAIRSCLPHLAQTLVTRSEAKDLCTLLAVAKMQWAFASRHEI